MLNRKNKRGNLETVTGSNILFVIMGLVAHDISNFWHICNAFDIPYSNTYNAFTGTFKAVIHFLKLP